MNSKVTSSFARRRAVRQHLPLLAALACLALAGPNAERDVQVVYNARLLDGANPVSGRLDFQFTVHTKASGGAAHVTSPVFTDIAVTNGELKGPLVFPVPEQDSSLIYIEAAVCTAGADGPLLPMQALVETCAGHATGDGSLCGDACQFKMLRLHTRRLPFSLDPVKPHRGLGSVQLPAALASSAPKGKMPIP